MVIKIEDLPKDRNIKKISFDIEFEDGGITNVIPQLDIEKSNTMLFKDQSDSKSEARKTHEEMSKDVIDEQFSKIIEKDMNDFSEDFTVERPEIPEIPERKEHKAVPSEMTDMEF